MSIFKHFAPRTLLPVKVDEIAAWVVKSGFANKITYYPMDRSPEIVAGLVRVDKYKPPYAVDEIVVADIPFSTQLPESEQRVIGAKEVIHILDNDPYVADCYDKLSNLISEIVIPMELMADMAKLTGMGMLDHTGILSAFAVLMPNEARKNLVELRKNGRIGLKEIAAWANIPETYVEFILGERWGAALEVLCK